MIGQLLYILAVCSILITLALIDIKTFLLPNPFTLGLLALSLLTNLTPIGFCSFAEGLVGAILGFFLIYLLNLIYRALKKTHAIGMGDAKLVAALGAVFGYAQVLPILFIASLACVFIQLLTNRGQKLSSIIAFGPYLCLTGIGFSIDQWRF